MLGEVVDFVIGGRKTACFGRTSNAVSNDALYNFNWYCADCRRQAAFLFS